MKPALVPAQGRPEDGPRQSDPPLPAPRAPPITPPREGSTQTPPPGRPHGTWAGVTAWTDPPAADPLSGARHQGTPNSPSTLQGGDAGRQTARRRGFWAGTFKPPPAAAGKI